MEEKKKRLKRWLRFGDIYGKMMPSALAMIGAALLYQGIMGQAVHGLVALVAFVGGLVIAYFPRFIISRIRECYADLMGPEEQPRFTFFQFPDHINSEDAFERALRAESQKLSGQWQGKVGSDSEHRG